MNMDNANFYTLTKSFFDLLGRIFKDKSIDLLLCSCHGEASIKDVDSLPKGSNLLTFAQDDRSAYPGDIAQIFPISDDLVSGELVDYQQHPDRFSAKYFLMKYLFNLRRIDTVPGLTISGGEKEFDYVSLLQYVDYKLSHFQMMMVLNRFRDYYSNPSMYEYNVLSLFNKLGKAIDVESIKSSQVVMNSYLKKHSCEETAEFYSSLMQQPKHVRLYTCGYYGPDKSMVFEAMFGDSDNGFCDESDFDFVRGKYPELFKELVNSDVVKDMRESCANYQPSLPDFGMALASLYIIKQLDDEGLLGAE